MGKLTTAKEARAKRFIKWRGLSIGVEYDPGDIRFAGTPHAKPMAEGISYGHVRSHIGADGEALDVYVNESGLEANQRIFRIPQLSPEDGDFDEYKFFIGFPSALAAKNIYLSHMPQSMFGGIAEVDITEIHRYYKPLAMVEKALNKLRAQLMTTKECRVIEESGGLPKIVEFECYGELDSSGALVFKSLNNFEGVHRFYPARGLERGSSVTREKISKGIQQKAYYSHPDEDPEELGIEPAGILLDIRVVESEKKLIGRAELFHTTEDGKAVAERIRLKDMPAVSIRTRPTCEDQRNLVGSCSPNEGMPLLLDFLKPGQRPGIPGSAVTKVIEKTCNKTCNCNDCIKPTQAGSSNSGDQIKGVLTMSTEKNKPATEAGQLMVTISGSEWMASQKGKAWPEVKSVLPAKMPEADAALLWAEMTSSGEEPPMETAAPDGEPPIDDPLGENYQKPTTEAAKKTTAAVKTAPAKPQPVTTAKEEIPVKIDKKTVLEALGLEEDVLNAVTSTVRTQKAKESLSTDIRKALEEARKAEGAGEFYGHKIADKEKYPTTAVESEVENAIKTCANITEAAGYLRAALSNVATAQKAALEIMSAQPKGIMQRPGQISVGQNREFMAAVEHVTNQMLDYIKEHHPDKYKIYERYKERNKGLAKEQLDLCVSTYGNRLNQFNRKAVEDVNPITSTTMPNYAAVMTAVMQLRYWIPSPTRRLFGTVPQNAMSLGRMIGNERGNIGQFVEIYTEVRDQRKIHDAAFRQLPSDPQREIGVTHAPYQYFAYQESTRVRWDSELEFFLSLAPLMTDVPARALMNLMEELDMYTEQRGSTEMLRANDSYQSTTITNETLNLGVASHFATFAVGSTAVEGLTITNAIGWAQLRRGQANTVDPLVQGPVQRPGVLPTSSRSTVTFPAEYPLTLTIDGVSKNRGMLQANADGTYTGVAINYGDPDPHFVLLPDVGIVVFLDGSLFDGILATIFTQYTKVNNFARFDFEDFDPSVVQTLANQFVEAVGKAKSVLTNRQVPAADVDFLLLPASANEAIATFASHFQGQNALAFAAIAGNYQGGAGSEAASFRNTIFHSTSEPLYSNNRRGILGTSGLTVVQELAPPELGDILPGGLIDQNGRLAYNSERSRSITRRHLIATIPRRNSSGAPLEFGYGSFFFDNVDMGTTSIPL